MHMTIGNLLRLMGLVFGGSEVVLAFTMRSRRNVARGADRGSFAVVWATIVLAIFAGILVANRGATRLPGSPATWVIAGLVVLVAGLALRWTAILTLRRAFTVDVAIAEGQRLVVHGVYRALRHPSYTGALLAFAGMGMAFGDWLAWLVIVLPMTAAFVYRIRVEERALESAFGDEYERYASRTRRLIPFVY